MRDVKDEPYSLRELMSEPFIGVAKHGTEVQLRVGHKNADYNYLSVHQVIALKKELSEIVRAIKAEQRVGAVLPKAGETDEY